MCICTCTLVSLCSGPGFNLLLTQQPLSFTNPYQTSIIKAPRSSFHNNTYQVSDHLLSRLGQLMSPCDHYVTKVLCIRKHLAFELKEEPVLELDLAYNPQCAAPLPTGPKCISTSLSTSSKHLLLAVNRTYNYITSLTGEPSKLIQMPITKEQTPRWS